MSETAIGLIFVLVGTPLVMVVFPWVLIYIILGRKDTFTEF